MELNSLAATLKREIDFNILDTVLNKVCHFNV